MKMSARLLLLIVISLASFRSLPAQPAAIEGNYAIRWGVKIPLRDHVELNATIYLPTMSGAAPTPVIFTLTPYQSDTYHARASYFAAHGYAFALVDVRGRGNSAGEFEPFVNEDRDGHDVVEWLAQQPFCNGKVTMWGGSYAGFDQWATAKELPPHLATIVPVAAAHPGLDFPFPNNVGQTYPIRWMTLTSGRTGQQNLFADSTFWQTKFLEAYRQNLPFKSLDAFVGNPTPNFQRIVQHPVPDAYYDAMTPTAEQFRKIGLPILTITGQYDGDELGAMSFYRDHLTNASAEARARHFLVIGPWDHAGTRTPTDDVGGVKFGPDSLLDVNDLHVKWYDWTLKGGAQPEFLKKRVAYYVLAPGNSGANGEWRYADTLEGTFAGSRTFFLNSKDGNANGVFSSGVLTEAPPTAGADRYVYDPLDLQRGELEGTEERAKTQLLDQRFALSIHDDGLVYHSDPLPSETALIGCPEVSLWLAIDTPDTDLTADFYEVLEDGTSISLWSDACRLRYRESPREQKLVKAGEVVRCDFKPGLFVARRLAKGSRLRLVITSPNSIFFQKNYNSGGVVAEESAKDAKTAHVTVYHDATHASALKLPLAAAGK